MTEHGRQGIVSDVPSDKDKHAQHVKELAAQLNFESQRPKEDKPKIRNRCGSCAAFHSPFCPWEYANCEGEETKRALHVDAESFACSLYFPRLHAQTGKEFEKAVNKL